MTIKLYDMAAEDTRLVFSPFAWRNRMCLLHKGLDFEVVPMLFGDFKINGIGPGKVTSVPVLQDGDKYIGDSWDIVRYLDETYPDRPLLPDGERGVAHAQFVLAICGALVFPNAIPIALNQAFALLDEPSKPVFRESREQMFGTKLENVNIDEENGKANLAKAMKPFDETFAASPFLGGPSPDYSDYAIFGVLKWVDIVSSYAPLDPSSESGKWFDRLQDMYNGYARTVPTVRDKLVA